MEIMREVVSILSVLALCYWAASMRAQLYVATSWTISAHAMFYGETDASGTMGGACGYANLFSQGYGKNTIALSSAMFNNGLSSGACFKLECLTSQTDYCYSCQSLTMTVTNYCPQGSYGGWCDNPNMQFDLSYRAFTQLTQTIGGVILVQFMRVPCDKMGDIRFTLNGNPWYNNVLVTNVARARDVQAVSMNGGPLSQDWDQVWTGSYLVVVVALTF